MKKDYSSYYRFLLPLIVFTAMAPPLSKAADPVITATLRLKSVKYSAS
jgi:hypothetical protein